MKMKTLAALALTAMMTVGLAACGSSSSTSSASSTAASSTAAAATSTAAGDSTAAASGSTDESEFKNVTGTITGSGSSALFPLAQDAADEFKKLSPDCSITMNAGGSGTGLKQVYDGSVDIGNSDVDASEKLDSTQAGELVDHKVCVISMAPIVNKDVTEGTRALFSEYALNGEEEASNQALETDDSGTLLQSVADTKGSIGYIALSYLVNNDTVSTMSIDGVEPTLENTYSGKWNVWGYEHMYTKGEAKGAVKAYIDYIMSDTYGQKMESLGYCVTSKMQVTR